MFVIACLANNNAENEIPKECQKGNYRELVGDSQYHRYFDYRNEKPSTLRNVHDLHVNYTVGFDNWFRFRLDNALRMVETKELEKSVVDLELVRAFDILIDKF